MIANFPWTFETAMGAIFICLVLMVLALALLLIVLEMVQELSEYRKSKEKR
jgi:hypothetical protein